MLILDNVSLRIAGRLLLDNVSLNLHDNTKAGIVGRNGTGKTSLFRAILNKVPLEKGAIIFSQNLSIGEVAQEITETHLSLIDYVLAADKELVALLEEEKYCQDPFRISEIHERLQDLGAYTAKARAASILAGLGFDDNAQNQPLKNFSGGWRMRVALAALLFIKPDFLLLDEPTNYLDLEGSLWLINYIKNYEKSALIISHDRYLLNQAVNTILHLENKNITLWHGNYDHFLKQHAEKIQLQKKHAQKLEEKKQHMQAFVNRFKAKASKAKQAQSRLKALEKLETIEIWQGNKIHDFNFPYAEKKISSPIITTENITLSYARDKPILRNVTLRIDADDRIALLGANGNGKTTLVKFLSGRLLPQEGTINRAPHLKIAYFSQHQIEDLHPHESAIEHVRRLLPQNTTAQIQAKIAHMGLDSEKMHTKVENLSGGEKTRLLMGLIAIEGIHLLILDEPTNHLDIESREALINALNRFEGAILLIAHDHTLIEATMERLWIVKNKQLTVYQGDMKDYHREILNDKKNASDVEKKKAVSEKNEQRQQALAYKKECASLKKKIQKLEKETEAIQKEIQKIEEKLCDVDFYQKNPEEIARYNKLLLSLQQQLQDAEELWVNYSIEYEERTKQ